MGILAFKMGRLKMGVLPEYDDVIATIIPGRISFSRSCSSDGGNRFHGKAMWGIVWKPARLL